MRDLSSSSPPLSSFRPRKVLELTRRFQPRRTRLQKTDTHIYLIMDFCSAGDLSLYIRKRGDLPSLTASNAGLLPDSPARKPSDKVLYPHPKEGGLNETIVRCFLGQLGASRTARTLSALASIAQS